MKKSILIILCTSLAIFSCKEKKDNKNQTIENIDLIQIDGGGFEPSWDISISEKGENKFIFELTTMMGEKKTIGNLSLENDFSKKENSNNLFKGLDNNGEIIIIEYKNESCLDMAGNDTG
ncbi:hypothetical protein, partial [Aquimarina aggregata]|uniref:hypothetical protein n=1 Tax=Aquimarina aggregata TaxID=1642818 RepID=UPI0024913399